MITFVRHALHIRRLLSITLLRVHFHFFSGSERCWILGGYGQTGISDGPAIGETVKDFLDGIRDTL